MASRATKPYVAFVLVGLVITFINFALFFSSSNTTGSTTSSTTGGGGGGLFRSLLNPRRRKDSTDKTLLPPESNNNKMKEGDGEIGGDHSSVVAGEDRLANRKAGDDAADPSTDSTSKKKRRRRKKKNHPSAVGGPWQFGKSSGSFASLSYREALSAYSKNMQEELPEEIEQSSNRFKDYVEKENNGVYLPVEQLLGGSDAERKKGEDLVSGGLSPDDENQKIDKTEEWCDPADNIFTPEKDERCMRYLSNPHNWLSVKAMSSILSTGRTIKFKVFFKHNNVTAIMKVSQKKFALEPASEVGSFFTDRILGFYKVPPVVWIRFPVDFLKAAAASVDTFYSQWFQKFVLDYSTNKYLIRHAPNYSPLAGMTCINISLQLWMFDVHDTDETVLNPPTSFHKYLVVNHSKKVRWWEGSVGSSSVDTQQQLKGGGSAVVTALQNFSLGELSDEFVFDYIIGNTDRWFGHNSFAFGGCEPRDNVYPKCQVPKDPLRRCKGPSMYAFIDQGSSFYKRGPPQQNPIAQAEKGGGTEHLCRYRKTTVQNLLRWEDKGDDGSNQKSPGRGEGPPPSPHLKFFHELKKKLPHGIFNLANSHLVKAANERLNEVTRMMKQCIADFGRDAVLFF